MQSQANTPTQHAIDYFAGLTEVYTTASDAEHCFPVAHIAEYYLEAWWRLFAAANAVRVELVSQ